MKRKANKTYWKQSKFASAVSIPAFSERRKRKLNEENKKVSSGTLGSKGSEQDDSVGSGGTVVSRFCYICNMQKKCLVGPPYTCDGPTILAGENLSEIYLNYTLDGKFIAPQGGTNVGVCNLCYGRLAHPLPTCVLCEKEMLDNTFIRQCRQCMNEDEIMLFLSNVGAKEKALKIYESVAREKTKVIPFEVWAETDLDNKWKELRDLLLREILASKSQTN